MTRMSAGWPLIRLGRPPAIHKKPQSPQSRILQAMHCSPCLADPHAPRIPIRATLSYVSADPPYSHQAPKNPTLVSTRPAFPAPQIKHPRVSANSLCLLPARYRMSRRGTSPPRPAAGLRKPTHSTNSLKFPGPTTGGHGRQGTASLCDATTASASQWEPAPACVIGSKGPMIVRPRGRTDSPPEGSPASSGLIVEPEGPMARRRATACLHGPPDGGL